MAGDDPFYLKLLESGDLAKRVEQARAAMSRCAFCGWNCQIDRSQELGPCRSGTELKVATAFVHFGEEEPLVAQGGSGTIFFSNCDLRCQFCHTYRWSILGEGTSISERDLADIMLRLQADGAANINLVTPTHAAAGILAALHLAALDGLRLPLVWNSGGYDSPELLETLDGIVDIYLPDMKFNTNSLGRRMSAIPHYSTTNRQAVAAMDRQVGSLVIDEYGRARRGLLIRHLIMPGHEVNTRNILEWIAGNIGPDTYLSLLDQYLPAYRAFARADINRGLQPEEFLSAVQYALQLGFTRLDKHQILDYD